MAQWKGRVALITGASSGIGEATADALASCGLRIALTARREDKLQAIADRLKTAGADCLPLKADFGIEEEILSVFQAIRNQWGGVDALVNCAGVGYKEPLTEASTAHWREMLEVNVLALSIATREAVRDMRCRGDNGHVIHLASMSGHRVPTGGGMYAASKHAVVALTEGLRQDLRAQKSGIRVTAISPGFVETDFIANYLGSGQAAQKLFDSVKALETRDVASAVCYALSCPPHTSVHDILLRPTCQES